jgi:hypothetical protein
MTRKSRLALVAVAVVMPMIAACSATPTGPDTFKVRRAGGDSTALDSTHRCGDVTPWGRCAS